jgi:hypothetical protein
MADVAVAYERDTIPDKDGYRPALIELLGVHAMPVWGWCEQMAYEEFAMAGPDLDHWVRTTNLWAEQERRSWEWHQLIGAVTEEQPDAVVGRAAGTVAAAAAAALASWIDMVFLAVCLDGLGEELVRTLEQSTYAPLRRSARTLVMFKRGQCADGCDSLAEVVRDRQFDREIVGARADVWMDIARSFATRTVELEAETCWVDMGIATALDVDDALERVEARMRKQVGDQP